MSNPFTGLGIDPVAIIAQTIGTMASVDATLTHIVPGSYDVNNPGQGNHPSTTTHTCRVTTTKFVLKTLEDELVRVVEGKLLVLIGTISPSGVWPQPGDTITLIPPVGASRAFTITGAVDIDGAGATAECEVQG